MILSKENANNKKCAPKLVSFDEKKMRKIRMIFDFLGKNLSKFVSPVWKLHNPYCHNVDPNCQTTSPPLLVTMVFKSFTILWYTYVLIQFPYVVWRISCENQEFLQLKLDWKKEVFGHKGCNFDLSHFGWLGLSKSLEVWHFAAAAELSKRQTEAESYFISIARCMMSHAPYR